MVIIGCGGDGDGDGDGTESAYRLEALTRERMGVLGGRPKDCCLLLPFSCGGGGDGGGGDDDGDGVTECAYSLETLTKDECFWVRPNVSQGLLLPMAVVLRWWLW